MVVVGPCRRAKRATYRSAHRDTRVAKAKARVVRSVMPNRLRPPPPCPPLHSNTRGSKLQKRPLLNLLSSPSSSSQATGPPSPPPPPTLLGRVVRGGTSDLPPPIPPTGAQMPPPPSLFPQVSGATLAPTRLPLQHRSHPNRAARRAATMAMGSQDRSAASKGMDVAEAAVAAAKVAACAFWALKEVETLEPRALKRSSALRA